MLYFVLAAKLPKNTGIINGNGKNSFHYGTEPLNCRYKAVELTVQGCRTAGSGAWKNSAGNMFKTDFLHYLCPEVHIDLMSI